MLSVDAGFDECLIEKATRGSDKRMTGEILLVSRLLADEEDLRGARSFAEDRLCRPRP